MDETFQDAPASWTGLGLATLGLTAAAFRTRSVIRGPLYLAGAFSAGPALGYLAGIPIDRWLGKKP
jgi:hypothetical protein